MSKETNYSSKVGGSKSGSAAAHTGEASGASNTKYSYDNYQNTKNSDFAHEYHHGKKADAQWRHGGRGSQNKNRDYGQDLNEQQINAGSMDESQPRLNIGTDAHPYGPQAGDPYPRNYTGATNHQNTVHQSANRRLPRDTNSPYHPVYDDDEDDFEDEMYPRPEYKTDNGLLTGRLSGDDIYQRRLKLEERRDRRRKRSLRQQKANEKASEEDFNHSDRPAGRQQPTYTTAEGESEGQRSMGDKSSQRQSKGQRTDGAITGAATGIMAAAGEYYHKAGDVVSDLKNKAADAYEHSGEYIHKASDIASDIRGKAGEVIHDLSDKASTYYNKASEYLNKPTEDDEVYVDEEPRKTQSKSSGKNNTSSTKNRDTDNTESKQSKQQGSSDGRRIPRVKDSEDSEAQVSSKSSSSKATKGAIQPIDVNGGDDDGKTANIDTTTPGEALMPTGNETKITEQVGNQKRVLKVPKEGEQDASEPAPDAVAGVKGLHKTNKDIGTKPKAPAVKPVNPEKVVVSPQGEVVESRTFSQDEAVALTQEQASETAVEGKADETVHAGKNGPPQANQGEERKVRDRQGKVDDALQKGIDQTKSKGAELKGDVKEKIQRGTPPPTNRATGAKDDAKNDTEKTQSNTRDTQDDKKSSGKSQYKVEDKPEQFKSDDKLAASRYSQEGYSRAAGAEAKRGSQRSSDSDDTADSKQNQRDRRRGEDTSDLKSKTRDVVEQGKQTAQKAGQRVQEKAQDLKQTARDKVRQIADTTEDDEEEDQSDYIEKAKHLAKDLSATAAVVYTQAAQYISKEAPELSKTAGEYYDKASTVAGDLYHQATDYIEKEGIRERAGELASDLKTKATTAYQQASEYIEKEGIKDKAADLAVNLKQKASSALSVASDYIDKEGPHIRDQAGEIANNLKEKASSVIGQASSYLSTRRDDDETPRSRDNSGDIFEDIEEDKSTVQKLREKVQNNVDSLKRDARNMTDDVSSKAKNLARDARDKVDDATRTVKDRAEEARRKAKEYIERDGDDDRPRDRTTTISRDRNERSDQVRDDGNRKYKDAAVAATGIVASAQQYVQDGVKVVTDKAQELDEEYHVTDKVKQAWEKTSQVVQDDAPRIKDRIVDGAVAAKDKARQLLEKGSDGVQDIKGSLSKATDRTSDLAKSAQSTIEKGINKAAELKDTVVSKANEYDVAGKATKLKDNVIDTVKSADEEYHLKEKIAGAAAVAAHAVEDGAKKLYHKAADMVHIGKKDSDSQTTDQDTKQAKNEADVDFKRSSRFQDTSKSTDKKVDAESEKLADDINSRLFGGKTDKKDEKDKKADEKKDEKAKKEEKAKKDKIEVAAKPVEGTVVKDDSVIIAHGLAEQNIKLWKHKVWLSTFIATGAGAGVGYAAFKYGQGRFNIKTSSYIGAAVFGLIFATRTIPAYINLNRMRANVVLADHRK